ncbi:MAG TPA: sugar kinase [Candidatus Solibacter sp.]|nr:sugar kinase [Candidatus Solibacter sp.]HUK48563.1 sugar kinase [Terriglobales bacterium]
MARFDVTIAGELNLDLILYGLPEQLLPERELLADRMMLTLGSSSAIVAHNLSALGSSVGFQSRIGDDPLGKIALERLQQGGVDVSKVRMVPGATTTGLTVILHQQNWRNILTYSGTIAELSWNDLDFDYLADSRHFHFSSYYLQKNLRPRVGELFQKLKAKGLTISLDTNDDPDDRWEGGLSEVLRHVDVFLPNEREACKAAATEDLEEAVKKLSQQVPLVVVKLGRKGAMAQRGNERIVVPAKEVVPVDSVGAGDSFDAGFLHEFVRGSDLQTCLKSGNRSGALSTTRPGGTEAFRDAVHREQFLRPRT